jgi:hypothetical protein
MVFTKVLKKVFQVDQVGQPEFVLFLQTVKRNNLDKIEKVEVLYVVHLE